MNNIQLLDCTLRDGGRVIDCNFSDDEIAVISHKLDCAGIDIIEMGFLRDARKIDWQGNSTFFTDVDQIRPFINKSSAEYVAFIDYGMFDFNTLQKCDGSSVTGLRVGFTKKDKQENFDDVLRCMNQVKNMGYKLFVQGVNSLNYTDREILELVDLMNMVKPYSFGIVDTYGAMYLDDVTRIFELVNNNLDENICIDFHSHNNYQLSFALAQQVINISNGSRKVIIDCTLNGMGKVAGNLNTELMVNFLNRKMKFNFDFEQILDLIDDYIYKYKSVEGWGYSIPALLSGVYKSHPNNVRYLTSKFRIQSRDVKCILSMIAPEKRQRYDYANIDELYMRYNNNHVDDYKAIETLKEIISDREVLVLIPGSSINKTENREIIKKYIDLNNPFVISVNYKSDFSEWSFWGNPKQFELNKNKCDKSKVITTSNLTIKDAGFVINYYDVIDRRYKYFENSTLMLLNLLKRVRVNRIIFAGFDGFELNKDNYINGMFQNDRHILEFNDLNEEIMTMLSNYRQETKDYCSINFLTPSRFDISTTKEKKCL